MLQARAAVGRRSWSHPQEPTGEDWWTDVLADPRARRRNRRLYMALMRDAYRLSDEQHALILVECTKCDWKAAYGRNRFSRRGVSAAEPTQRTSEAWMHPA